MTWKVTKEMLEEKIKDLENRIYAQSTAIGSINRRNSDLEEQVEMLIRILFRSS